MEEAGDKEVSFSDHEQLAHIVHLLGWGVFGVVPVGYMYTYLIFVIFFTEAKFSENKIYIEIYTVNCQFSQ